jgi:hypothetical protein
MTFDKLAEIYEENWGFTIVTMKFCQGIDS